MLDFRRVVAGKVERSEMTSEEKQQVLVMLGLLGLSEALEGSDDR